VESELSEKEESPILFRSLWKKTERPEEPSLNKTNIYNIRDSSFIIDSLKDRSYYSFKGVGSTRNKRPTLKFNRTSEQSSMRQSFHNMWKKGGASNREKKQLPTIIKEEGMNKKQVEEIF